MNARAGRDAVLLAVERWYNFSEFEDYLGNVGSFMNSVALKAAIACLVAASLLVLSPSKLNAAGSVKRCSDEGNPHGIELTIPDGVRIESDYQTKYLRCGKLRSNRGLPTRHKGIDILGRSYGDPLIAPFSGKVTATVGSGRSGGRVVIENQIKYPFCKLMGTTDCSYKEKINVKFVHVGNIFVNIGDTIDRGYVFGTMVRKGVGSIPHAHMETLSGGTVVNPHKLWVDGVGRVTCFDESREYTDEAYITSPVDCKHRSIKDLMALSGQTLPTTTIQNDNTTIQNDNQFNLDR